MNLKIFKKIVFFVVFSIITPAFPKITFAHCPLCTVGAAAAGGIAAWLGVSGTIIGLFIGAASLSLGWWFAKQIKKKYVPYQTQIITLLVCLSVVLPVYPMFGGYTSVYLSWFGNYGGPFHNTYLINLFLLGSIVGAIAVFLSPILSRTVTGLAGRKLIPFQGLVITLVALILISFLIESLI